MNLRARCVAVGLALSAMVALRAMGQAADYVYVPPQPAAQRSAPPFGPALKAPFPVLSVALPQTRRADTAAESGSPWVIGDGLTTAIESADLFDAGLPEGPGRIYTAGITVPGAQGVRLQAALEALGAGDALWISAPGGAPLFGPYTVADGADGPRWLPTVFGDTCILLLRAPAGNLPVLRIEGVSRMVDDPRKAFLPCPAPVACADDPLVPQLGSGVGLLLLTFTGSFGQPLTIACTGALLNNPLSEALEPFLLSANHCFDAGVDLRDVEVLWDQRFATCNADGVPPDTALRSRGDHLLVASPRNDLYLFALDSVPVGPYGRAWLGWDSAPALPGEAALALHHPLGAPLSLAIGNIDAVGLDSSLGRNQSEVIWRDGFTESGSSGSPALLPGRNYRVFGALSNGNRGPGCGSAEGNVDRYGTLSLFYPRAAPYLYAAVAAEEPAAPEPVLCPIALIFGREVEITKALRTWRDTALLGDPLGDRVIAAYRDWAPGAADVISASPAARALVGTAALPFAWWAGAFAAP